jgi:hypothetical protein
MFAGLAQNKKILLDRGKDWKIGRLQAIQTAGLRHFSACRS